MTSTNDGNEVLKSDRRGWVRVPKERREALLAEFARSGVSGAEFARLTGVKYATFIGWVAKARREVRPTADLAGAAPALAVARMAAPGVMGREPRRTVQLFEALVTEAPRAVVTCRPLLIELPGGARLQLAESAHVPWAAELLRSLRSLPIAGAGAGAGGATC